MLVPDFTIEAGIVGEPPGLRHYTIMAVGPVDDLRKTVRLTADHELAGSRSLLTARQASPPTAAFS
jgi:hypothetical protein